MRSRRKISWRSISFVIGAVLLSILVVMRAIDITDGEMIIRGRSITAAHTPALFRIEIAKTILSAPLLILAWIVAVGAVGEDRSLRRRGWQAPLERPEFRSRR